MNKDQVKGTAKDVSGKIQEETGKLVGSKEQEAKGLSKQVAGKAQKSVGNAKEATKDSTKNR
ncbi:MAG: CsbD family protein [Pseudomonadota bacterium]|nr:CsbD family protein [Pseudomonadota bacterium]